jgi:hypothetical protein
VPTTRTSMRPSHSSTPMATRAIIA